MSVEAAEEVSYVGAVEAESTAVDDEGAEVYSAY